MWEHVLTRSHAWISTCDGLAFSLWYTWDTPATHLQHIYNTLEIHLQHTCNTFKIHLRELVSIVRLAYTCMQLAHHLRYTCKTHLQASAHKINICKPPVVNLQNLLWIYSMVKVIKTAWPLVWHAGSHCFLGVSNWWWGSFKGNFCVESIFNEFGVRIKTALCRFYNSFLAPPCIDWFVIVWLTSALAAGPSVPSPFIASHNWNLEVCKGINNFYKYNGMKHVLISSF